MITEVGARDIDRPALSSRMPDRASILDTLRVLTALPLLVALLTGCEAFSSGDDDQGQLGDGVIGGNRVTPGAATASVKWLVLRAGFYHNCGIKPDGSLWCWGFNNAGQLGNGIEDVDSAVPVQVGSATDWNQVAPGLYHTCGIRTGQMWCWGAGSSGQLGDGLSTKSLLPVRVGTASDWKEVTTGGRFSCGIRGAGDLYCWGSNGYGQLGVGDYTNRATPSPVADSPWKKVDAGRFHACAISAVDIVWCWGRNEENQVNVFLADLSLPSPVSLYGGFGSLFTVLQVRAGSEATCIRMGEDLLDEDRDIKNLAVCVGQASPTLSGSTVNDFVGCDHDPCDLETIPRFREIDLTDGHACGILVGTNQAQCWGEGSDGQIGDGFSGDRILPSQVFGAKNWATISTGARHTIGLELPD